MKFKTFAWFVGPSLLMMLLFILAPLISVFWQSFNLTQPVMQTQMVETCTPGFITQICVTEEKTIPVLDDEGNMVTTTTFVGFDVYRELLQPEKAWQKITAGDWKGLLLIDFWGALRFTLTFTFITLPLVIGLGLGLAVAVNSLVKSLRGSVIFITLLPFIITPVIGALSIKWLFIGDGILTAALEWWLDKDIAMFAEAWTIEFLMLFYRVWHAAPFAFVVFYAGLQTINSDSLESAVIDGASRLQQLWYIVIPHLMPLIVFVSLIHLMDAYRVFEEIVGFSSQSHVISLQWLTYEFLVPDQAGNRSVSRASASAMLTMIGIIVLLIYPLRKTWKQYYGGNS